MAAVGALALISGIGVVSAPLGSGADSDGHPSPSGHGVNPDIEPKVCNGCQPPLLYQGGPVMDTTGPNGVTITPIYWDPAGSPNPIPSDYERIIDTYIANIAAASGQNTNEYSVETEYYQVVDGAISHLTYHFHAGTPVIDTDPFPANGCKPTGGNTSCITDDQMRTELTHLMQTKGLPVGLANYYPLFLGPKVEAQDRDGTNSVTAFCGYHRAFGSSNTTLLVYADIPYTGDGCTEGQAPNGDLDADGAVNVLSHETNEAVTDPTDKSAWVDQAANEIGDMCSDTFGAPLGSTSAASPKTTLYNQVINGAKYYTQREFSDVAFDKLGDGSGCVQSEAQAQSLENSGVGTNAAGVSAVFADAYPTTLSNSGSTSKINISVADGNGDAVQGDQVHFSVGNLYDDGDGDCGTLTKADT